MCVSVSVCVGVRVCVYAWRAGYSALQVRGCNHQTFRASTGLLLNARLCVMQSQTIIGHIVRACEHEDELPTEGPVPFESFRTFRVPWPLAARAPREV